MERYEEERKRRLEVTQIHATTQLKQRHDAILATFRANRQAYRDWDEQGKDSHKRSVETFQQTRQQERDFEEHREQLRVEKAEKQKEQRRQEALDHIAEVEHTLRRLGRDGSEEAPPTTAPGALVTEPPTNEAAVAAIRSRKEDDIQARKDRLTRQFRMEAEQTRLGAEILQKRQMEGLLQRAREVGKRERDVAMAYRQKRVQKIVQHTDNKSLENYHKQRIKDEAAEEDRRFADVATTKREETNAAFAIVNAERTAARDQKKTAKHTDVEAFCKLATEQVMSVVFSVIDHNTEHLSDGTVLYRTTPMPVSSWRGLTREAFSVQAFETTRNRLQRQAARERHAKKRFQLSGTLTNLVNISTCSESELLSQLSGSPLAAAAAARRSTVGMGDSMLAEGYEGSGSSIPTPAANVPLPPALESNAAAAEEAAQRILMEQVEYFLATTAAFDASQTLSTVDEALTILAPERFGKPQRSVEQRLFKAVFLDGVRELSAVDGLTHLSDTGKEYTVVTQQLLQQEENRKTESRNSQREAAAAKDVKKGGRKSTVIEKPMEIEPPPPVATLPELVARRLLAHFDQVRENRAAARAVQEHNANREQIIADNERLEEEGEDPLPVPEAKEELPAIPTMVFSGFLKEDAELYFKVVGELEKQHDVELRDLAREETCGFVYVDHHRSLFRRLQEAVVSENGSHFHHLVSPPPPGTATSPAALTFERLYTTLHSLLSSARDVEGISSTVFPVTIVRAEYMPSDATALSSLCEVIAQKVSGPIEVSCPPSADVVAAMEETRVQHESTKQLFLNRLAIIHQSIREAEVQCGVFLRRCLAEIIHALGSFYEDMDPSAEKTARWAYCDEQRKAQAESLASCLNRFEAKTRSPRTVAAISVASLLLASAQHLIDAASEGSSQQATQLSIGVLVPLPDLSATELEATRRKGEYPAWSIDILEGVQSDVAAAVQHHVEQNADDNFPLQSFLAAWEQLSTAAISHAQDYMRAPVDAVKTFLHCANRWNLRQYTNASNKGIAPLPPRTVAELQAILCIPEKGNNNVQPFVAASAATLTPLHVDHLLRHFRLCTPRGGSLRSIEQQSFVHSLLSAQVCLLGLYIDTEEFDDDDDDEPANRFQGDVKEEMTFLPDWWLAPSTPVCPENPTIKSFGLKVKTEVERFFDSFSSNGTTLSAVHWMSQLVLGRVDPAPPMLTIPIAPLSTAQVLASKAGGPDTVITDVTAFKTRVPWWTPESVERGLVLDNLWKVLSEGTATSSSPPCVAVIDIVKLGISDTTNLKTIERMCAYLAASKLIPRPPEMVEGGKDTSSTIPVSRLLEIFPVFHSEDFDVLLSGGKDVEVKALSATHWGKVMLQQAPFIGNLNISL